MLAALLLMVLGLGLVAISRLVGVPLPMVHDDPDHVEVVGLALLTGYGILAGTATAVAWRLAQHLPPSVRRGLGRLVGTAVLLVFAATGVLMAVEEFDIAGVVVALASGYAAVHVALGIPLPFDNEDDAVP